MKIVGYFGEQLVDAKLVTFNNSNIRLTLVEGKETIKEGKEQGCVSARSMEMRTIYFQYLPPHFFLLLPSHAAFRRLCEYTLERNFTEYAVFCM